jgi:hypothetical protein
MKASLFVSTYEMPRHLELVCAGLARQSHLDFEVLFCDDGSGAETAQIIREFIKKSPVPAKHVWQEHQGFRKCKILNRALQQAQGQVMVFLDGDCIPHHDYIRDHLEQQEPGHYLAGRRVELGEKFSQSLSVQFVSQGGFDSPSPQLLWSVLHGDSEYFNRSIRVPWHPIRKLLKMDRIVDLKGCNYSVAKSDLETINGFDEEYEGYGREDTDVELRLINLGLKIKSLKGLALQYHVWHPRREFTPRNDSRLADLKIGGRTSCLKGLKNLQK